MHRSSFQEQVVKTPTDEITLIFSAAEFAKITWETKYHEFEVKGKWYDVTTIEKTKEGFIIHCVNDSIEEVFVAMIDHWKKSNSPTGKTKILFQPTFCPPQTQIVNQVIACNKIPCGFFKEVVHRIALPIPSPPPELQA